MGEGYIGHALHFKLQYLFMRLQDGIHMPSSGLLSLGVFRQF